MYFSNMPRIEADACFRETLPSICFSFSHFCFQKGSNRDSIEPKIHFALQMWSKDLRWFLFHLIIRKTKKENKKKINVNRLPEGKIELWRSGSWCWWIIIVHTTLRPENKIKVKSTRIYIFWRNRNWARNKIFCRNNHMWVSCFLHDSPLLLIKCRPWCME